MEPVTIGLIVAVVILFVIAVAAVTVICLMGREFVNAYTRVGMGFAHP